MLSAKYVSPPFVHFKNFELRKWLIWNTIACDWYIFIYYDSGVMFYEGLLTIAV